MPKGIYPEEIKQKAIELRKQGFTYSEIPKLLNYPIPKNTFTGWFKNVYLSVEAQNRIKERIKKGGSPGRVIAWENTRRNRVNKLDTIYKKVSQEINSIDYLTAKISLAMLYLAEGGKVGEFVRFCNSDPKVIQIFLTLLRRSFTIKETKLRGRVQCRVDQDIEELEKFWSQKTNIPLNQFQKPFIDSRTIGKPTKRLDYKGVFVVIYCSSEIFLEVKFISDIIYERLNLGS